MKSLWLSILIFVSMFTNSVFAQTQARAALIGIYNEYVEPSVEESVAKDVRELMGRYAASYKQNEVSNFKMLSNPNNQYFKPVVGELSDTQKQFLKKTAEDNGIDIIVLNSLRESSEGLEMELQLYDARIETLSATVAERFSVRERRSSLETLVYRSFNHVDRDGFVHPDPQDFFPKPTSLAAKESSEGVGSSEIEEVFETDPEFLGRGRLADDASIGGEQTPFWEKWWFWTIIGGTLITAGGLSYYFLVVDQPPRRANTRFNLPANQN